MAKRKYTTEFGLNVFGTFKLLLQQDDFERPTVVSALQDHPCHIYMICRRPRIGIVPESVFLFQDKITGKFRIQRAGKFEEVRFSAPHQLPTTNLRCVSEYPFTEYRFVDTLGKVVNEGKTSALAAKYVPEMGPALRLEVLYVGQAFGKGGSRTAIDRLKNHSTLQAIYAEAANRSPDQETWLLLWHFSESLITSIDPRSATTATPADEKKHQNRVLSRLISHQQTVNFTEAALIRYFAPAYNTMFRGSFPNPAHTTYRDCYDLDLNMINVELHTDDINTELWSADVKSSWFHNATFHFETSAERRSMFEI